MLHDPTVSAIIARWSADIDTHVEAGRTPVLDLGYSHNVLESTPAAIALQSLLDRRTDTALPVVVAGGSSQLWLAALLHDAETDPGRLSPGPLTLFAGADMATYMASLTTATSPVTRAIDSAMPRPADLAANLQWHFAPSAQPGQARLWDTLAIRIMEVDHAEPPLQSGDEEGVWLLAASLLMVIALILFALFV